MPKNIINNKSDPLDVTSLGVDGEYTLPTVDGTNGQVLETDGAGNVSWTTFTNTAGLTWNEVTTDTNAVVGNGYICNNAITPVTITLPATFSKGDAVFVFGKGAGGWRVKPSAGDTLYWLDKIASFTNFFEIDDPRGCVRIYGITDNSEWEVTKLESDFINDPVVEVALGDDFLLSRRQSSQVDASGKNFFGQLGDNAAIPVSSPVTVVGSHIFQQLDCATSTSFGLKADGSAWSWGSGTSGILGDNTIISKSSPISVVGSHSFTQLYGGVGAALALKANGEAWTWGENIFGQLGDNTNVDKSSPVSVIGGHSFITINTSGRHACALKANGEAWTWGLNTYGELGNNAGASSLSESSPVSVVGGHSFIKISGGLNLTLFLKADGSCWSCGFGSNGQLGDDTTVSKSSPVAVVGSHSFVDIHASNFSAHARKADGSVWCWGNNGNGQLGNGTTTQTSSPVSAIGGHSFSAIAAQLLTVAAIKADGTSWAWGQNTWGQFQNETIIPESSPILVSGT